MSAKGQITLPAKFLRIHHIHTGDRVTLNLETGRLCKLLTNQEWAKVLKDIPIEDTYMDCTGHYDPKRAPHFDKWIKNG